MARSSTSFKPGNQWWNRRTSIGRKRLFTDPKSLWKAACEYFEDVQNDPIKKVEAKVVSNGNNEGSSVEMIEMPLQRPFSLTGLCLFLDCGTNYFRQFRADKNKCTPAFSLVISKIEETIYNQQYDGATSGIFKENIIARALGLSDKVQSTNLNYTSEPMDKTKMKEIAKELDDEL